MPAKHQKQSPFQHEDSRDVISFLIQDMSHGRACPSTLNSDIENLGNGNWMMKCWTCAARVDFHDKSRNWTEELLNFWKKHPAVANRLKRIRKGFSSNASDSELHWSLKATGFFNTPDIVTHR